MLAFVGNVLVSSLLDLTCRVADRLRPHPCFSQNLFKLSWVRDFGAGWHASCSCLLSFGSCSSYSKCCCSCWYVPLVLVPNLHLHNSWSSLVIFSFAPTPAWTAQSLLPPSIVSTKPCAQPRTCCTCVDVDMGLGSPLSPVYAPQFPRSRMSCVTLGSKE